MSQDHLSCDVAVLGGGPAGCAAAIELARLGQRVVLLERDRFPRFHIGESLLPTTNRVFAELGLAERVRAAGFPEKWGASLATWDAGPRRYVDFSMSREIAAPQTYQVERAKLDQLLLERAVESGVDVRQEHRAEPVRFGADGVEIPWSDAAGARGTLAAKLVVDATGRAGLLARQLDLRVDEPELANIAVYAHFEGVPRPEGKTAGDIRIVARHDLGWFWLIPINARLTSVGVVLPKALFQARLRESHETILPAAIADTPFVAELMKDARQAWPTRIEREFTYACRQYAGDRWLLAGDAGSFLDPVFSTGVAIALESGLEAARAAVAGLAAGEFSARAFASFDRRQRARYLAFRRFVVHFYTPSFRDLFFQEGAAPNPIYRAIVTLLGGHWRPRFWTRRWLDFFFLLVRLQKLIGLAPRLGTAPLPTAAPSAREEAA